MEFIHIFWFHEKNENVNVENNYLYIYTFYFEGEVMCNESETHLVMLLNQLCSRLQENPALLEVFFKPPGSNVTSRSSSSSKPDQFIIFSILLRFLHTEGVVGGQARDALLLCMALSETHEGIGEYITATNFCHVRWFIFSYFFPEKIHIIVEFFTSKKYVQHHIIPNSIWSLFNFQESDKLKNRHYTTTKGEVF